MGMFISIVIPAYNAEKFINRCMDSVYRQKTDNLEMIIVDDGSKDNTLAAVQEYIKAHDDMDIRAVSVPNGGLANARNTGYAVMKGDYFINLDADDFLGEGIIARLQEKHNETDFDVCFYGFQEFEEDTGRFGQHYEEQFCYLRESISGEDAFLKKAGRKIWICQGSACYRTSLLERHGIRNIPGIDQGEDYYLIMCLLACSKTVACVPQNGVFISWRKESMMHASFQKSHLQVFQALDNLRKKLRSFDFLNQAALMDAYAAAEYEINRLSVAKKIAGICRADQPGKFKRAVRAFIPPPVRLNRHLLGRKKRIESVIFYRMPGLYFYIVKTFGLFQGRKKFGMEKDISGGLPGR